MDDWEPPDETDYGDGLPPAPFAGVPTPAPGNDAINLLPGNHTDTGNAQRLVRWAGACFLHVAGIGWHRWTGTRWRIDGTGSVIEACKDTIRVALAQAYTEHADALAITNKDDPRRKRAMAIIAHYLGSESASRLRAMRDLAATDPCMCCDNTEINKNAHLIAHGAGTYDAKTGKTRPALRGDLLTIGTETKPNDEPFHESRWLRFLREIQPDPDTRAYLQRAIGLSLIGRQDDHVILFCHGDGGNGKGTFFRAIAAAIGDYYSPIPSSMLMESVHQPHAAQVADLMGKRMVVSAEVRKGAKLDEEKVKELTGGDMIKAQFMRENWFSFPPSHTLWINGNDKPRINGTDRGIWRRMRLIPFVQPLDGRGDRTLDADLAAEAGIVLQWCLDGVAAYMRDGLGTCGEVDAATAEYRTDSDILGQAIAEICDAGPSLTVSKKRFRIALQRYYDEIGLAWVANDKALKADMQRRGITETRPDRASPWCWHGIALKPEIAAGIDDTQQPGHRGRHWND